MQIFRRFYLRRLAFAPTRFSRRRPPPYMTFARRRRLPALSAIIIIKMPATVSFALFSLAFEAVRYYRASSRDIHA